MSRKVLKLLMGKSELLLFLFSSLKQACVTQCKGFSVQHIKDTFMFSLRSPENGYKGRFLLSQTRVFDCQHWLYFNLFCTASHPTPPYQLPPGLYWDQLNRQSCFSFVWFSGIWVCLFLFLDFFCYLWILFLLFT